MYTPVASAGDAVSDDLLIAAVRRGSDGAFEALYLRYNERVARFVRGRIADRGRAEDVVQDVFLSALRRMRATDNQIVFRPWIFEIAKNAAIDSFRRASRTEEVSIHGHETMRPSDQLRLVAVASARPENAVLNKERLEHLQASFGGLSDNHHRVLVLREFEGRSYREIAQEMDMSRPAVESALFRARRRLQHEYARVAAVA